VFEPELLDDVRLANGAVNALEQEVFVLFQCTTLGCCAVLTETIDAGHRVQGRAADMTGSDARARGENNFLAIALQLLDDVRYNGRFASAATAE